DAPFGVLDVGQDSRRQSAVLRRDQQRDDVAAQAGGGLARLRLGAVVDAAAILHPRLRAVVALHHLGRLDAEAIGILDVVGRLDRHLAAFALAGLGLPGDDRLQRAQLVDAALRRNRAIEERDRALAFLRARLARRRRLLIVHRPAF